MNIFINTVRIIKYTINKNNNTSLFYDYISDEELTLLQTNFDDLKLKTMYGTITKHNFSFSIIHEDNTDYNDIKLLLSNKLYEPTLRIKNIVASLQLFGVVVSHPAGERPQHNNIGNCNDLQDNTLSPKSRATLAELMITTEALNKELKNKNNDIILTEHLGNSSSDDDELLVKENIQYTYNMDDIETEKHI